MKIIGKTKDYFDYLVHQYGVDPLVVLDRRGIGSFNKDYSNKAVGFYSGVEICEDDRRAFGLKINCSYFALPNNKFYSKIHSNGMNLSDWLIVNGKGYPLVQMDHRDTIGVFQIAVEGVNCKIGRSGYFYNHEATPIGVELPMFVKLSKMINRHCFILQYGRTVVGDIPVIGNTGLSAIVSPQEMYVDTVRFIAENFAKKVEEAIPITNKEKIVSHGFDLKVSFRGKQ